MDSDINTTDILYQIGSVIKKPLFLFALSLSFATSILLLYQIDKFSREISNIQLVSKIIPPRSYKIGFITDIHATSSQKARGMIMPKYATPMDFFINHMNYDFHPDFSVQCGDLIEGSDRRGEKSVADFKAVDLLFSKLSAPIYYVIGNHEYRGLKKNDWVSLTKNETNFYYFDYKWLRVIILDNQENDGVEDISEIRMTANQLGWLEETLKKTPESKRILVFTHNSPVSLKLAGEHLYPPNAQKMIDLFAKHKVMAVFSGHREILNYEEIENVQYFVIPGLYRSKNKLVKFYESFAEIYVKRKISAKLFYKKEVGGEYQILTIPSKEYDLAEK